MMTYDPTANSVEVRHPGDLELGTGALLLSNLRKLSLIDGTPSRLQTDWQLVRGWLGGPDGEPTPEELAQLAVAWRSYTATYPAPKPSLEVAFTSNRERAKAEGWEMLDVPQKLADVFDRLLATDDELNVRKAKRALQLHDLLSIEHSPKRNLSSPIGRYASSAITLGVLFTAMGPFMSEYRLYTLASGVALLVTGTVLFHTLPKE
jgi:hypothetical protein